MPLVVPPPGSRPSAGFTHRHRYLLKRGAKARPRPPPSADGCGPGSEPASEGVGPMPYYGYGPAAEDPAAARPWSRRAILHDFSKAVTREQRARAAGLRPAAGTDACYDPSLRGCSASRRVQGFLMRRPPTAPPATPHQKPQQDPNRGGPAADGSSGRKLQGHMDKWTSREKMFSSRWFREDIDVAWHDGEPPAKRVPGFDLATLAGRKPTVDRREPGQHAYVSPEDLPAPRVAGGILYARGSGRPAGGAGGAGSLGVALDAAFSQCSGAAANGRHVRGVCFSRSASRSSVGGGARSDRARFPLKIRWGLVEHRLRTPLAFSRQLSRAQQRRPLDRNLLVPSSAASDCGS
ncbi:hypothetical protein DIPPA_14516 [Diplonema papillatum]|nr:hypothetical protein DIPPA_14516 [Diplonema papillatum]